MIFKIIPMINPDGVIIGNYRTGVQGYDYNRKFAEDSSQNSIIHSIMDLAKKLKKNNNLIAYFDLHGHSIKKNSFAYGPEFSMDEVIF